MKAVLERPKRRLLSVIHGPVFGGGHNQMIRLHEPLRARGWETIALGPTYPGNAAERVRGSGIELITMPLGRVRASLDPRMHARLIVGLVPEVRSIRRLLRARAIDLVQVHGPLNAHAAVAAHLEDVAVVWQLDDTRTPIALRRIAMPFVVRLADAMTTVGRALADAHPGAWSLGDRLIDVYPPVDLQAFSFDEQRRTRAREAMAIPEGAIAIGTVGNLNPSKGHEFLIRAAASVVARHARVAVRLVGGHSPVHAEYEAGLRREAAELGLDDPTLRFIDPKDRVPDLMPGLDVLVMASVPRSEGIPTVILEAMCLGLPVVATDVGAVREAVEHAVTGYVVAPESPGELATALERLAIDADIRRELGRAGRDRFAERFDMERLADLHVRAYALALGHRATRRNRRVRA